MFFDVISPHASNDDCGRCAGTVTRCVRPAGARLVAALAAIVLTLACLVGPSHPACAANAYDLDALVFFGDSLTDEGRAGRTAPVMWSDALRGDLSIAHGANYAIGGAITSNQPSATFGDSSYLGQVNSFVSAGGPHDPKTGAAIWIGTNNIVQGATRGLSPTAVSASAAQDVAAGLAELRAAGVSSFVLLGVYDLSLTNAYMLAGADTMSVRNSAAVSSLLYNALLQSAAASGSHASFFNIANFLNYMQLHPAEFGLTNVLPLQPGQTCDARCQQTSLFSDTIHLTSRAQQLIGDYVASGNPTYNTVNFVYGAIAGNIYSVTHAVPMTSFLARAAGADLIQSSFSRLDAFHAPSRSPFIAGNGVGANPWSMFGAVNATASTTSGSGLPSDISQTILGLTAGIDYSGIPGLHVGGLVNYAQSEADMMASAYGDTTLGAVKLAGYASWVSGNGFAYGLAGAGYDGFSQQRRGSFGEIASSPDGMTYLAAARAGHLFDVGAVRIGPVVGLSYIASHVFGYTEDGAAPYRLSVGGQTARSLTGSLGYQIRPNPRSGWAVDPVLTVTYEREFLKGTDPIAVSYANLPTQSLPTRTIAGQDAIRASLGAVYAPTSAVSLAFNGFGLVTASRSHSLGADLKLSYRY